MAFDRQSSRRIAQAVHDNESAPPAGVEANRWNASLGTFWARVIGTGGSGTYKFRRIKWTGIATHVDIDTADRLWLCSSATLAADDIVVVELVGEHNPTTGYRQPLYRVQV